MGLLTETRTLPAPGRVPCSRGFEPAIGPRAQLTLTVLEEDHD